MLKRIYFKKSIYPIIFSTFYLCFFHSQIKLAWSQQKIPKAVVMGLNTSSAPAVSEQILLQILREKLENNFNLSSQSAFEKSFRKKYLLEGENACMKLKCILDVHRNFPQTNLFLLKSQKNKKIITLVMVSENHKWLVKHEVCSNCGFTSEEMVKNLALIIHGNFNYPLSMLGINSSKPRILQPKNVHKKVSRTKQISYSDQLLRLKDIIKKKEPKLPLEEFKYKLAQKQYNKLIGNSIKRDLMFFRHENPKQVLKNLKAQLRLQINQSGKVIDRMLIRTSGSNIFDKMVLDSVDLLKLPPPMELLIKEPPYVVTISIQP